MIKTLDSIHIDILDRIFGQMYYPYLFDWDERWYSESMVERMPAAGLLPLSLVCKRLRAYILPWIFRDVRFSIVQPHKFFPSQLWPYIHVFRFFDKENIDSPDLKEKRAEYIQSKEEVYQQLPQLPHVHTLHFMIHAFSTALVHTLTSMPHLSSLFIANYPRTPNQDLPFHQFRGISRLIHVTAFGVGLGVDDKPCNAILGKQLFAIMEQSASSLVHLDIPGEHTRLDALGQFQLTALRTLILRGRMSPHRPNFLWPILSAAPNLQVLEIYLFVMGAGSSHFVVLAEDIEVIGQEAQRTHILSDLREFTLANAHPDDHIFRHLPSSLRLFSLPVIPVWLRDRGRSEFALSADAAFRVLMRCNFPSLFEFRISIEGELPPELFGLAATSFPLLQKLEVIHRLPVREHGSVSEYREYSLEAYATSFTRFRHLQVLNVDWPLTNNPPNNGPVLQEINGGFAIMNSPPNADPIPLSKKLAYARLFAHSIPSLLRINFWSSSKHYDRSQLPCNSVVIEHLGPDSQVEVTPLDFISPLEAERLQVSKSQSAPGGQSLTPQDEHLVFQSIGS